MCVQAHTFCLSAYGSMTLEGRIMKREKNHYEEWNFESLSTLFKVMSEADMNERESESIRKQKEQGVKEM